MNKCLDMSMDAGQEHAIQAFDQQLYATAQQVTWSFNFVKLICTPW
jgi:hypothetical protein